MVTFTPTPRLARLMLGGLGVMLVPFAHAQAWPAAVFVGGALLVAALSDLWTVWRAELSVEAVAPSAVPVGDAFALEVSVQSARAPSLRGALLAEVSAPLIPPSSPRACALPAGTSHHTLAVRTAARGEGAVHAVWLRAEGPLGLVARLRRSPTLDLQVRVVPALERLRKYALERLGEPLTASGSRLHTRLGEGSELDSLQAYARGMDLRNVDWKASARHNALRVWRFRHESHQNVVVAVDTGRLMAVPIGALSRLDHAVHAALLLAEWALGARDLVALHAYGAGPRLWVPPAAGLRHAARMRHAVSELAPESEETNHALGIQALLSRLKRRSMVVVFTDFVDTTTAEIMVEYLGQLAKKHVVIFVALDDPAMEGAFAKAPRSLEAATAAAVVDDMSHARALVLGRLRHAGVQVIHGPPGRATLDLLAAYVDVKRRSLVG